MSQHPSTSPLTPADEGLHPWGPADNWQESAVLAWRDPESGLGGNHRISVQPNRGTSNLWCAVFHQRDKIYRLNLERQPFVQPEHNHHGFSCGPQRIFHDGQQLRLQLDTPECQADLVVEDFRSSTEYFGSKSAGKISAEIYSNHFNIHCRVTGTVVLNGVTHTVRSGLGWRDHSWGPRSWDSFLCHRSFHGNFGENLNFHLLTVLSQDGKLDRRGHLVRNGIATRVDTFTTRVEILEDGVTPVRASCHIFLPDEAPLTFTCEVQKGVMARVEMFEGFFGVGACYHPDQGEGFCNVEIQNNPRQGRSDLQVALGNTLHNGYTEIDLEPWKYLPLPA
jgi:hypothetical protein